MAEALSPPPERARRPERGSRRRWTPARGSADRSDRWLRLAAVGLLFALPLREAPAAANSPVPEARLKAAFLYQFVGYVEWPPEALPAQGAPFTIGVVGGEELARELRQTVKGRSAHGRPIEVKRLDAGDTLDGVQLLFIGADRRQRLEELVPSARRGAVLVVTESEGALDAGSVINFLIADQRIRFEVSLAAAEQSGLKLSSRLLDVAQRVVTGED